MHRSFFAVLAVTALVVAAGTAKGDPASELAASCWARGRSACDPRSDQGCAADAQCRFRDDTAALELACLAPGQIAEGAACSAKAGQHCARGTTCWNGICRRACCADAECTTAGQVCVAFERRLGTMGVCDQPPACRPAAAACTHDGDCCSKDCHVDHCH